MKKIYSILLCFSLFTFGYSIPHFNTPSIVHAEREIPPYAKWGDLAVQKTKEKYPNANVTDYLHIGREQKSRTSIEKFKLLLKENNKEFEVFVNIEFTNDTEELINISFKEIPQ